MRDLFNVLRDTLHHVVDSAFVQRNFDDSQRRAYIHEWIDTYTNRAFAEYQERERTVPGVEATGERSTASELSQLHTEARRPPTHMVVHPDSIAGRELYGSRRATGEDIPPPGRHPQPELVERGQQDHDEGTRPSERGLTEYGGEYHLRSSLLDPRPTPADPGRGGSMSSNYAGGGGPPLSGSDSPDGTLADAQCDRAAEAHESEGPAPTDWTAGMEGVRRRAIDTNGNRWEERRLWRLDGSTVYWWQTIGSHVSGSTWPTDIGPYSPRLLDREPWSSAGNRRPVQAQREE